MGMIKYVVNAKPHAMVVADQALIVKVAMKMNNLENYK